MVTIEALKKGITDHMEWKRRLKMAVQTNKVDLSLRIIGADDQCELGKWLHGPDLTCTDRQTDHYAIVHDLHALFHVEACKVAELVIAGKKQEAEKSMDIFGGFSRASSRLTNALAEWQKAIHRYQESQNQESQISG